MRKLVPELLTVFLVVTIGLTCRTTVSIPNQSAPTQIAALGFYPQPQPLVVDVGDVFTVACVIEDVVDLVGLNVRIAWDTNYLSYVSHTATIPVEDYPIPVPPSPYAGIMHEPELWLRNDVDPVAGTYWVMYVVYGGVPSFSGSGTVFVMTFKALAPTPGTLIGFTTLELADSEGYPILYLSFDGVVNIVDTTPPDFESVGWKGTSPSPYVPSGSIRVNEPVAVSANITDLGGVAEALLSYRVDGGAWWNTTMAYNVTSGLWTTVIPGQLGGTSVEFFITATDNEQNTKISSTFAYNVRTLLVGDVDGDGDVDIFDIVRVASNYGKTLP